MKRSTKAESYGWAEAQRDLEDGLHRALRTALQGRGMLHARVLDLDTSSAGATT